MLKLDFLGHYDLAEMLMLAASVIVVVSIQSRSELRRLGPPFSGPSSKAEVRHRFLGTRQAWRLGPDIPSSFARVR